MAKGVRSSKSQALNWLLVGGSLVTLFIWANTNDPFNAPKSWVMFIAGAYLAGWAGFQIKDALRDSVLKIALILSGAYLVLLFLAFLFTNEKFVGFFGENARRTGFLTYFCLTIFFLSAALLFRLSNLQKFDFVTLIVGPIVGLYGFSQHFKIDAIKWNNPYNSVLSTLGNPDFASAVMGIFLVLIVGVILNRGLAIWIRLWGLFSSAILTITILFSGARQGLLAALIGIGIVVVVYLFQKNKVAGYGALGLGLVGFVVGVLGMLNTGPASKYLYKVSVTYRGDYWRAGINMFKHHFLFGVGLDRYGSYFRQYRDATQSLRRGPDVISNAAHDVPIQLAATGGILVLLVFIALFVFVAWRGFVVIRRTSGVQQLVVASFVGAWITYEAQSFISIDNVGIAIWGWILGGLIVGISVLETEEPSASPIRTKKRTAVGSKESAVQPLVSGLAATIAVAIVIPLFLADSSARMARSYAKPTAQQMNAYVDAVKKPLTYGFQDPANKFMVATLLAEAGRVDEGIAMLKDLIATDPQNFAAFDTLANIYEQTNRPAQAVPLRKKAVALDPFNPKIVEKLNQDLKASGK